MNPAAKEFVPAHILKKRQEEAAKLAQDLDKVNITNNSSDSKKEETSTKNETSKLNGIAGDENSIKDQDKKEVQDENSSKQVVDGKTTNAKIDAGEKKQNGNTTQETNNKNHNNQHHNHSKNNDHANANKHENGEYPEGLQEFIEQDEDDRYLLNAGEDICEFNGEQFIIPRDEDCEPQARAGYDFGNAEDNEDEDVCNAFEEFLENLPNQ